MTRKRRKEKQRSKWGCDWGTAEFVHIKQWEETMHTRRHDKGDSGHALNNNNEDNNNNNHGKGKREQKVQ